MDWTALDSSINYSLNNSLENELLPIQEKEHKSLVYLDKPTNDEVKPAPERFYMLFVFFCACFSQGITWTPLSALP
jgi:hypothetical protein